MEFLSNKTTFKSNSMRWNCICLHTTLRIVWRTSNKLTFCFNFPLNFENLKFQDDFDWIFVFYYFSKLIFFLKLCFKNLQDSIFVYSYGLTASTMLVAIQTKDQADLINKCHLSHYIPFHFTSPKRNDLQFIQFFSSFINNTDH